MIDIPRFLNFLKRRLWVIALVALVSVGITYYLVRNLPEEYASEAQLVTGIADRTQELLGASSNDYYRATQQFNSLIEMMQSRNMLTKISIRLLVHDLENPEASFRPLAAALVKLTPEERRNVVSWYKQRLVDGKAISVKDNGRYPYYDYLGMMGYGQLGVTKNLRIARRGDTDIVNVGFTSENAELSAYLVNTLAEEFINHYYLNVLSSETSTMGLLDSMLKERKLVMDEKNELLRSFKASRGVVNIDAQAEALYQQIAEYETKRSKARSDVQSINGAIKRINDKLRDGQDTDVNSNVAIDNNELLRLGREIEMANRRYVDNSFSEADKRLIDSLERVRSRIVAGISNKQVNNPQANRQNLIQERTTLEIELARVENSVSSIERDLSALKGRYYTMAPAEAGVQDLEREAQLAVQEYTDALNRYNQADTENAGRLRLRVIQEGLPGTPASSKKNLFVAASGVGSIAICVTSFLIFFLLDNRIIQSKQLSARTNQTVMGAVNFLNGKSKDLRDIWQDQDQNSNFQVYKDLIRALRFELTRVMTDNEWKVLGITSVSGGEGKTFITSSLAYAFALTGKKVLVISDDCRDLTSLITNEEKVNTNQFESFLIKKEIKAEDLITVLRRRADNTSILELRDAKNLIAGFDVLKNTFDIILIDINSLKDINVAKEWLMFTDCSLAVFKSGSELTDHDKDFLQNFGKSNRFLGWVLNQVKTSAKESVA